MKSSLFVCLLVASLILVTPGQVLGQTNDPNSVSGTSSDPTGESETIPAVSDPDTAVVEPDPSGDTAPAQSETLPPVDVIMDPQPKPKPKPKAKQRAASPVKVQNSSSGGQDEPPEVTPPPLIDDTESVPAGPAIKTRRELENAGEVRVPEAIGDAPNVNITGFGDGRSTSVNMRGVGALRDPLSPGDTSFVVYVDGVPQPLFAVDADLLDIERVELLKGPQGTLFGLSTTAGALNVITRKPSDKPEFSIRSELGEDGHALAEFMASGPLIPRVLAGRLALRLSTIDGFVPNTLTGNDLGEQDVFSGRGTLRFTPSLTTAITLSFSADHDKRTFPFFLLRNTPEFPVASYVDDNRSRRRVNTGTLTIEHKAKDVAFKSTTGLTQLKTTDLFIDDTEGFAFSKITGLPPSTFSRNDSFSDWNEDQKTLSQEFLFSSLQNENFSWVVGASYFHNNFTADYLNEHAFVPASSGKRRNELVNNSFAGFGEVTVPIGPRLRVTPGARFTHERKTYDLQYLGVGAPGTVDAFQESGELAFNYATGRLLFAYELTPDSTAHATISRGFKSGGYPRFVNDASLGIATEPFASSKIWAYEAGYKYRAPKNIGYFDATAFYNDIEDEQLLDFDSAAVTFRPANLDVITYGLELAAGISVTDALKIAGAIGYTKAEFINVDPILRTAGAKNGNRLPNVPKLTASAALDYRQSVEAVDFGFDGHMFGHIGWRFVGDRAADEENRFSLDAYHIVDGRIGIEPIDGVEMYIFAKNLLDTIPQLSGGLVLPNAELVVPGRGRIVGAGTSARW